jgi:hypothetical protein
MNQSAWSQHNASSERGIPGYLDPKTGTFKLLPRASAESEQPAAVIAPTTGKLVYNFTINVASLLPSSAVINCSGSATIIDVSAGLVSIEEEASTVATRSGSKATCTVTIPYSWPLANASADTVQLGFTITAGLTTLGATRVSTQTIATIKVPASGSTTTHDLTPTI